MLLDIFYSFLIILIIVGIFFFINHYNKNKNDDCPDILIQQGKKCPELYLQKEYNIQGDPVFINRKSPFEKEGGTPVISGFDLDNNNNQSLLVDSTRNHPPFNNNLYPGFDPMNQYVGIETPLDKMYNKNSTVPPILTTTKYEGFQFN